MAEIHERSQPRISVTKLGEYMVANPARRRRIVIDQKRPQEYIVARYNDAQESIVEFLVHAIEKDFLRQKVEELSGGVASTEWQAQSHQLCAEAISSFLEFVDGISLEGFELRRGDAAPPKLDIAGVSVSVRPEVLISGNSRKGDRITGAIKLYISKTTPLTGEAGEYVATTVHQFVKDNQLDEGKADFRLCYVVDVFNKKLFSAPRSHVRRRSDIEAACEEIARAWAAL
jgi:hypothetical protein